MKFLSLRWKIGGILIVSNLILGVLLIIAVNRTVSEDLGAQLIARGRTIAANLAQYSAELLLKKDVVGLRQLINSSLNFESVQYILIHDNEGHILADNFNSDVPDALKEINYVGREVPTREPDLVHLQSTDVYCYDVWMPVEEGYLGYIRVGIKEKFVSQTIAHTNLIIIITILAVTVIGIIIVILLANRMITPILYLTRKAEEISQGQLEQEVSVKTGDEIEKLAGALDRLRESVKIALDRLKKNQQMRM